jgi:multimeric flavodoxin WrbA
MKIATIMGSPRKEGNTAKVLRWVEEELKKKGHTIDRINVIDYKINGCLSCYNCFGHPGEPSCIQKDDGVSVLERLVSSDAIIYGSPLYCWGFTAQIKALIDRHFCLVSDYGSENWTSLIENKKSGLLVTCGGPDEGNADFIRGIYKSFMEYAKCDVRDILVVPFTTVPEKLKDEAKQAAIKFAHKLVG